MRPAQWEPAVALSASEQTIVKRIRRANLFILLRQYRHEVFDRAFQEELASLYQDSPRGQPPVVPALLALATQRMGPLSDTQSSATHCSRD